MTTNNELKKYRKQVVIGSRASQLALTQTIIVKKELEKLFPNFKFTIKEITTKGDKILDKALSAIGDKGLFTRELENAILNREIDFAVHSLKDLPSVLPQRLMIGAVTKREDPRDVIIAAKTLQELKPGSIVGTSSLRRKSQLKRLRPDLLYQDIRGNLNTRLKKLDNNNYDAIILASAGIKRLNLTARIKEYFPVDTLIPAVCQGILGIECREDDTEIRQMLSLVNHPKTEIITRAERAFLSEIKGGCQVPLGAIAEIENNSITINGFVSDLKGERFFKHTVTSNSPESAGISLAQALKQQGAEIILKEIIKNY
jgi:hydroxymethylbilane synthase